jgi:hypothetical protein
MKRFNAFSCLAITLTTVAFAAQARAADPTIADCLTASESALTLRNQHKLRDARDQLLVCAATSCPVEIREECTRRVADVNAAMPTVVFEVKDAAGNDLSAAAVTIDGAPLSERLEGIPLSIDPGQHAFVFTSAGQPTTQKDLLIREGDKGRRERIVLGAPGLTAANVGDAGEAGGHQALVTTGQSASQPGQPVWQRLGKRKFVALAAAGVGVVGLGLGIGFGLASISRRNDAVKACPSNPCTDRYGVDMWDYARSAGNMSTIGFIIGAVGVAGGAALWFIPKGKPAETRSTQVGLGLGTLQLKGVW